VTSFFMICKLWTLAYRIFNNVSTLLRISPDWFNVFWLQWRDMPAITNGHWKSRFLEWSWVHLSVYIWGNMLNKIKFIELKWRALLVLELSRLNEVTDVPRGKFRQYFPREISSEILLRMSNEAVLS
jgi:hypothetical protein